MARDGVRHRADIVTPGECVVELQSRYLPAAEIAQREAFYGHMVWLYRAHWQERLHWGRRGFWWKHGAKSMTAHRRPVYWDVGDEIWRVRLNQVGRRVLGVVKATGTADQFAAWLRAEPHVD
jgi:hypothetical protein